MASALARRSFHGPFHAPRPRAGRPQDSCSARALEPVWPAPSQRSLARAALGAAPDAAPTSSERERVLANLLSALQRLTRASR